ncbi:putative E3 ubiquitin-protein ligase UBR7 isoform X3 [Triplophysa dalaica]|uniref:putative E3 ubiquitin-protein ligase UBR7 isoform X3 n=2 Tax=Triplophysa dalaica TaxID=1582913 RepID=UPI0024DF8294|nr:putative E3 ubiquitin-protein ligase UBR7 isoform X3 [Triplophysa dalaica]
MNPTAARELCVMDQTAADELYEAFAMLAGSDPDNCSYTKTASSATDITTGENSAPSFRSQTPMNEATGQNHSSLQGYMKRQAVFACNTCVGPDMEPAGVCLACANHCHDGHDISELYTKRKFRCDCGNQKFDGFTCRLRPEKDGVNVKNMYNHNYFGRYCSCDRPYPDEDDQVNEEMIQCIVCEDWYHARHLDNPTVNCDALMEMICVGCMNRAPFLWTYAAHFAVSPLNEVQAKAAHAGDDKSSSSTSCSDVASTSYQMNETMKHESETTRHRHKTNSDRCVYKELTVNDMKKTTEAAIFWPYHWRSELCTCTGCKRLYVETGVPFLLDESDTLLAYEKKAETESVMCDDVLLSCISSLDHTQQLDIIYQYNDLKQELCEFLHQSTEEGKDVTPDICREFLEDYQMRKRRRLSSEGHYSS